MYDSMEVTNYINFYIIFFMMVAILDFKLSSPKKKNHNNHPLFMIITWKKMKLNSGLKKNKVKNHVFDIWVLTGHLLKIFFITNFPLTPKFTICPPLPWWWQPWIWKWNIYKNHKMGKNDCVLYRNNLNKEDQSLIVYNKSIQWILSWNYRILRREPSLVQFD